MNNSERIYAMTSYDDAREHFLKVNPLKSGNFKGHKPLGGARRYTRALIRMDDEVVVCSYYKKDVVKYFPNGEIHLDLCGYNTASTREFIYNTTRINATMLRGQPHVFFKVNGVGESFLFPKSGPLVVKDRKVMNSTPQIVYRVNRKAMNEVRERYADFIEYCKTMGSVMEDILPIDVQRAGEIIQDKTEAPSYLRQLMFADKVYSGYYRGRRTEWDYMKDMSDRILNAQATQDYEQMSARFTQLAVSNMYFNSHVNKWIPRIKGDPVSCYALGAFYEMLKYVHRDEVFVAQELPMGKISGTTNQHYFSL